VTSSNASSAVAGLSNVVLFRVERVGYLLAGRESSDVREVKLSPCRIGDLPEISNDLLYDSNDSREMEKGSLSLKHCRWLLDDEVGDLSHPGLFSVGDGGRYSPLSLTELNLNSFGSIRFSLSPNANEGLSRYGLVTFVSLGVGRVFSSGAGSVLTVGRLEVKGMRKGGMVGNWERRVMSNSRGEAKTDAIQIYEQRSGKWCKKCGE